MFPKSGTTDAERFFALLYASRAIPLGLVVGVLPLAVQGGRWQRWSSHQRWFNSPMSASAYRVASPEWLSALPSQRSFTSRAVWQFSDPLASFGRFAPRAEVS